MTTNAARHNTDTKNAIGNHIMLKHHNQDIFKTPASFKIHNNTVIAIVNPPKLMLIFIF